MPGIRADRRMVRTVETGSFKVPTGHRPCSKGELLVEFVSLLEMVADFLTKILSLQKFLPLRRLLEIRKWWFDRERVMSAGWSEI